VTYIIVHCIRLFTFHIFVAPTITVNGLSNGVGLRELAYKIGVNYLTWSLRQHNVSVVVEQITIELLQTVDTLTEVIFLINLI